MKIYVLGQSGSGKTFFSQKIASLYNLDCMEMDELHKSVGYDLEKFYKEINTYVDKTSSWIIDGKYRKVRARIISEADKIYFLDFPLLICIFENVRRELISNRRITSKFIKHLVKVIKEFSATRQQIYKELEGNESKTVILKSRSQVNKLLLDLSNDQ